MATKTGISSTTCKNCWNILADALNENVTSWKDANKEEKPFLRKSMKLIWLHDLTLLTRSWIQKLIIRKKIMLL